MSDLETVERIAALETQYVKDQMLIDRLNRRNAELLDALKKVLSFFGYSDSMAADYIRKIWPERETCASLPSHADSAQ